MRATDIGRRGFCALAIAVASGLGACAGDAPTNDATHAVMASKAWRTLDGQLTVELPMDLLVQPQKRSVLATSSDGGFRFYLGESAGTTLPEHLGAMKDELIGLGWEVDAEQHFESAVRVDLIRGKKPNRSWRSTWIIEVEGGVVVCEGIAREAHRPRLGDPLRATCRGLQQARRAPSTP